MVGENDTWHPKTVVGTEIGSRRRDMADFKHLRSRPIEEKSICHGIF